MQVNGQGDPVELLPGVRGFALFRATDELDDPPVKVELTVQWSGTSYALRRLEVDGDDLPRDVLDRLQLRELLARAVLSSITAESRDASPPAEAALAYRVGLLLQEAPVQRVMEHLGVSRATASRRVAEARAAGLLGEDERAPRGGAAARYERLLTAAGDHPGAFTFFLAQHLKADQEEEQ